MSREITEIVLWLLVLDLGIAFGAGLYESRIALPRWIDASSGASPHWNADAARRDNVGLRFWVFVTTVPLTLLTLISLIALWWTEGAVHTWWLVAAAASLVERVLTFSYFIPTMIRLMDGKSFGASQAVTVARQWAQRGYLRHALGIVALLAALKTFASFYQFGG